MQRESARQITSFARGNVLFSGGLVFYVLCIVCLSVLGSALSWGHAPQSLLKVKFTVKKEVLECEVDIHYSQLYCLKSRQAGEVTEDDYPEIVRTFQTDCPVRIDGKVVPPTLKSFSEPLSKLSEGHHHHDLDDLRYGKIILQYPLVASPKEIQVKWPLISSKEDDLKISWLAAGGKEVFTVSNHEPMLLWKKGNMEIAGERSQGDPIAKSERSTPPPAPKTVSETTPIHHHSPDIDQPKNLTTFIGVFSGAVLIFLFVTLLKKRK